MSELTNIHDSRAAIRWKLLMGVSALALTAYVSSAAVAKAEDSSHPLIWIELDGQFAKQAVGEQTFLPPFLLASQFDAASLLGHVPSTIWNEGAKISFQPEASDWVFSAGIRVGRIGRRDAQTQLTNQKTSVFNANYSAYQLFTEQNGESHTILDFQAGRDVGFGKFGSNGSSLLSVGVRYARFDSRSSSSARSMPTNVNYSFSRHRFYESFAAKRKFTGVGPSLSWDASAGLIGNPSGGNITLDWGVNGAVLFGRQKMEAHHQATNVLQYRIGFQSHYVSIYEHRLSPARSKNVIVPNLGGFAGISFHYTDAKVSFGYRADMFFGAIDGGIDVVHRENRGFYGPFASVSVGIGG